MFKFLKDKLKDSISKITKDIKEEGEEEVIEESGEKIKEEDISEAKEESKPKEEVKEPVVEKKEEKTEEEEETEKEEEKKEEPAKEEKKQSIFKRILPFGKKEKEKEEEEKKETEKEEEKKGKEREEKKEITEEKPAEPAAKEEKKAEEEKPEEKKEEAKGISEKETAKEKEPAKEEKKEIEKEKPKEIKEIKEQAEPEEEKKSIFSKIKRAVVTKKINEKQFDDIFWDLEIALLENNVAVEVIDKIKNDLKGVLIDKAIARGKIEEHIMQSLKSSINNILSGEQIDLLEKIKEKKPYVMCFVGINGSGKTTTIAKVAYLLKSQGLSCCLAAADTFRAAAIDQLAIHAERLGVKIIKHDYGADPAAVAFDAIKHAEAKNIDVVLIDTAGRIHSDVNLQDEMKKIIRVAKPDMKIFVGESITGNDCVEQAMKFNESIELDGIILSKADIDEKGGAAISISYVTKKPIIYLGMGQEYGDLVKFDKEKIMENLGL